MKKYYLLFIGLYLLSTNIIAQTFELTSDVDGIGTELNILNTPAPISMINFLDYPSGFTTGMKITVENKLITTTGAFSYGISALANPAIDNNTGDGLFNASYSIYGEESSDFGMTFAGYFSGDVTVTGTHTAPSDLKLKENIRPLNEALNVIEQLNPTTYEFRNNEFSFMHLPKGKQYGLIAQEVEALLPELVQQNLHPALSEEEAIQANLSEAAVHPAVAYKSVNYLGLIPVLVQGVKEQQAVITEMKKENDELKKEMETLRKMIESVLENQEN